jgi:hypothetical protein
MTFDDGDDSILFNTVKKFNTVQCMILEKKRMKEIRACFQTKIGNNRRIKTSLESSECHGRMYNSLTSVLLYKALRWEKLFNGLTLQLSFEFKICLSIGISYRGRVFIRQNGTEGAANVRTI